ncbi:MAG: isoprenylcysteine carboxylmethyltransferase family protein [Anaerolineaceae bacterium]|jgi:protein-S-isoprenylcysteine O-methyltransferase Ste14
MLAKKILPPTYLLISILVMVDLGLVFPIPRVIPPFWNLLGLLPVAFGVLLNLVADRAFQQAHTTVKPFFQSSSLVTEGAYQVSRNPMYLGFALVLIGIAILLRSLAPYLVIALFVLVIDRVFIRVEEQMLADQFGGKWEAYRKQTRRWI